MKRKGARSRAEVPREVLAALHRGELETANLVEALAMDFSLLLEYAVPDADAALIQSLRNPELTITKAMQAAGQGLFRQFGDAGLARFAASSSDTVRGWGCYIAGAMALPLDQRLDAIRPFADDPHFGVREWAWMAMRSHIIAELPQALALLAGWAHADSPNIRRFASEATRPRGVWCASIPALKAEPALGLPILEPLKADDSRYVQDSVANWLNDAGKTCPDWVRTLTTTWAKASPTPATLYICKRATRNL